MEGEKNSVAMIKRTFEIIDYIFERNGKVSFSDLEANLKIPKATIFRIISTLESEGIINRVHHDKYQLGKIFVYYGETVKSDMTLLSVSRNILEDLAEETGETVNLNISYKDMVLNILSIEGEESILSSKLVPISPFNCSSTGKLFLAHRPENYIKDYFKKKKYEQRTSNSIIEYKDFMKEREKLLKENLSYDDEEYEYGLFCLGMPLKNYKGEMVAGVSISAPKARIQNKNIKEIQLKLSRAVDTISEILIKTKL